MENALLWCLTGSLVVGFHKTVSAHNWQLSAPLSLNSVARLISRSDHQPQRAHRPHCHILHTSPIWKLPLTATPISSIRLIAHIATFSRSPDRSLPAAAGLVQLHCWGPSRTCQAGCLPANTEKQHNKYLKFSRKYRETAQQINPDIWYESCQ